MFCKNCGFEFEDGVEYCPQCGAAQNAQPQPQPQQSYQQPYQEQPQQPYQPPFQSQPYGAPAQPFEAIPNLFAQNVSQLLSSGLFLAIAILFTAAAAIYLISAKLNITILFAIFMWIAYASAKKGTMNYNHLRNISGTIFADKVIMIVAGACLGLSGILITAGSVLAGDALGSQNFAEIFEEAFAENGINSNELFDDFDELFGNSALGSNMAAKVIIEIIGIVLIVFAVLAILYAIFGIGSIHKCIKSTYEGVKTGNPCIEKLGACKGWLMTIGVGDGLSALTTISNGDVKEAIAVGCMAAAHIIAYVLVGKLTTWSPQKS